MKISQKKSYQKVLEGNINKIYMKVLKIKRKSIGGVVAITGAWERKLGEGSSSYLYVSCNIFSLLIEDAHDFPL